MKFIKAIKFLALILTVSTGAMMVACGSDDEPDPDPNNGPQVVFDPNNCCFVGKMTTDFVHPVSQEVSTYESTETEYNFVIDSRRNLCTVKIINAKYAAMMPPILIQLKNLDYDYTNQTVSGKNIVAENEDAGVMVPNPRYTFSNFKATFADKEHSAVRVEFEVAGIGNGTFVSTGIRL